MNVFVSTLHLAQFLSIVLPCVCCVVEVLHSSMIPFKYPTALLVSFLATHDEHVAVVDRHADEDGIKVAQVADTVRSEAVPVVHGPPCPEHGRI